MAKYKLIAYNEDFEEEILSQEKIEDIDRITKNFNNIHELCTYLQKEGYNLPNNTNFKIISVSIRENRKIVKTRKIVLSSDYQIIDILTKEENSRYQEYLKIALYNRLYDREFFQRFSKTDTYRVLTNNIPSNIKELSKRDDIIKKLYKLSSIYLKNYLNYRDLYFDMKASKSKYTYSNPEEIPSEPSIYSLISDLIRRINNGEITGSEAREELITKINLSELQNIDIPSELSIDSLRRKKQI